MARPNRSDEKRRELLPRLARAFADLGYRRTTTAELARRCQARETTLYRLWPDKKAMFIAAIRYVYELSEETWSRLASAVTAGGAGAQSAAAAGAHSARVAEAGPQSAGAAGDAARPAPVRSTVAERLLAYESRHHGEFSHYRILFAGLSEADDVDIRAALADTYQRFAAFVAAQIAGHRGERSAVSPAPRAAAWALVGLGTVASIARELGLLGERQRQRLFSEVGRVLLRGTPGEPPAEAMSAGELDDD